MFKRLKKRLCLHDYEPIGLFYKESLSKYRNDFDKVNVYKKCKCKKCSKIDNVLVSTEEFAPELYNCGGKLEKIDYKYDLKKRGIRPEVDLYLVKRVELEEY